MDSFAGHPRVVILSDIANEPDDQMSFVRLLLYSNELDLEAMIASTSTWQKTATHTETMHSWSRRTARSAAICCCMRWDGLRRQSSIGASTLGNPRMAWRRPGRGNRRQARARWPRRLSAAMTGNGRALDLRVGRHQYAGAGADRSGRPPLIRNEMQKLVSRIRVSSISRPG